MMKPNFFIVGAPKCGTTALYEYLSTHPNVFVPPIKDKEPHYFARDFYYHKRDYIKSFDQYMKLFQGCKQEHQAVGEASVLYLYSSVAIKNIYDFDRNAKIIVMLRNPVDMAYSLYCGLFSSRQEDKDNFEKAWILQSSRKNGRDIPKQCLSPELLQYSQIAKYSPHMERLFQIFPDEQVKVIVFEEFVELTLPIYKDVLSFLGVPYDGKRTFPRINENKITRIRWIEYFSKRPPRPLMSIAQQLKDLLGVESLGIGKVIIQLNTKKAPRVPLSRDFRSKLSNEFREDIDKLSRILKRDLSEWKT